MRCSVVIGNHQAYDMGGRNADTMRSKYEDRERVSNSNRGAEESRGSRLQGTGVGYLDPDTCSQFPIDIHFTLGEDPNSHLPGTLLIEVLNQGQGDAEDNR
jgi:hypothetical protein